MIASRPDKDGQTLLNAVITEKRTLPPIRRIVEAGANPMTLDGSGTTSAHLTLRQGAEGYCMDALDSLKN
jgi:hypothetical protein